MAPMSSLAKRPPLPACLLGASALAATCLLAACAGGPQGRPFDGSKVSQLQLGHSTRAQAVALLGPAHFERVSMIKKDMQGKAIDPPMVTRFLMYEYAEPSSSGAIPWVPPKRELYITMVDDVVLGHSRRSTFKEDSTDFEVMAVNGLKKGLTTDSDVLARLGPPSGRSVWPIALSPGGEIWMYAVDIDNKATHVLQRKRLHVYLDAKRVVENFSIETKEMDSVISPPVSSTGGGGGYTYTPPVYVPPPSSGSFKSR